MFIPSEYSVNLLWVTFQLGLLLYLFPKLSVLQKIHSPWILDDFIDLSSILGGGTIVVCGNVGKCPYFQKTHAEVFKCDIKPWYSAYTFQWFKINVCVCVKQANKYGKMLIVVEPKQRVYGCVHYTVILYPLFCGYLKLFIIKTYRKKRKYIYSHSVNYAPFCQGV